MSPDLPPLRTVEADGPISLRTWDGPDETTFVLIHGLGGSHLNWVQVAQGLAGLGKVHAIDLPGFGTTPLAGRPVGVMALRRALAAFLEAEVRGGQVVLVGNSMGGAIAILHAAIAPEQVAGLVLTSPALPWAPRTVPHLLVATGFAITDVPGLGEAAVDVRLRRIPPERIVRMGLWVTTADPSSIPEDVVRLHVELVRQQREDPDVATAFLGASRSLMRLGRRPDVSTRALDAVGCPVLLLHGRRDRLVPAKLAEEMLRRYPAWRGRFFPDLGHVPQMEAPGRWLSEVADWYSGALT
jgi:pimeloyl-ACP methyl ester carboxylesterase